MATSSHDGGGATGEGKSLGARRARLNQLKADPLPSARPPPEEIVFGTGRPAPRLRGRAALGPSPISNVDSRAAVDRGAALPPVKKGGRGRLRQVAVGDESFAPSESSRARSGNPITVAAPAAVYVRFSLPRGCPLRLGRLGGA